MTRDRPFSALYHGVVRHARYTPKKHRFAYRVFSVLLDIDKLETLTENLRLFSLNRFNLFGFYESDHGAKDGSPLRPFIESLLQEKAVPAPEQILVMCYPRILGYAFNPITVYYCLNENRISSLIYEVNNTFGDDHLYVVPVTAQNPPSHHNRAKKLHVSPFMTMDAEYSFTTDRPDDGLKLVIREKSGGSPLLLASFVGQRAALTDRELLRSFFRYPLMTLKILAAIHIEALRLFLKGVGYVRRPEPGRSRVSYD